MQICYRLKRFNRFSRFAQHYKTVKQSFVIKVFSVDRVTRKNININIKIHARSPRIFFLNENIMFNVLMSKTKFCYDFPALVKQSIDSYIYMFN